MERLKKWLMGNARNAMPASVFWNLVSSMEYSFQSAVLMLAVTRSSGLSAAGAFTIAYTVTQMMSTIGSYGMRSFQVSDLQNEYSFHTYFTSRIFTAAAMVIFCLAYAWSRGYSQDRMLLVTILCFYRLLEVIEDIVHGEMQKVKRLDTAARIEAVRIFAATAVFITGCFVVHNVIVASFLMGACSLFMTVMLNRIVLPDFHTISFGWNISGTFRLLLSCFPVCVSGFLYNYLVNAPKYVIDRNLSEEAQAVFSILFMPIFIINVMSSFIYKPLMTDMGIAWIQKELKKFFGIVARQTGVIVAFTLLAVAGGNAIGLKLLGMIYGVDLHDYRHLFTLLLFFGGIAAFDAFFVIVLTTMRKQNWTIFAYSVAVLCVWGCMDKVVGTFGLWGAGILYGIVMGIILSVFACVFLITLYKEKNK